MQNLNENDQPDLLTDRKTALALELIAIQFAQYRPSSARTNGLSNQQIIIMACISDQPGCSVKSIIERTNMFQSTVSRSLSSLIANNLVISERCQSDTRVMELCLSPAGEATLGDIRSEWRTRVLHMLGDLTSDERETMLSGLDLLLRVIHHLTADSQ